MTVRRPGPDDLRAIARRFHFTIPDDRMPVVEALLEGFLAPYDRLDELVEPRREPRYPRDGGAPPSPEDNPLGARAMYLYRGGNDTLFRIHGSNQPWTIGQAVSSGCFRMRNEDVTELYSKVSIGTKVVVL